ncbi:hypothetical protein KY285_003566 [Solanum tuberosum]|nr:hypothetical protein KY285_003566 [Solanum tuberosum]
MSGYHHFMPTFWNVGLGQFIEAELLLPGLSEKKHLQTCITHGHLTVDPEQPTWLKKSNLLIAAAILLPGESSQGDPAMFMILRMLDDGVAALGSPPASKQVMANLPVTIFIDEFLMNLWYICGVSNFQGGVSCRLEDARVSQQAYVSPSLPEAMWKRGHLGTKGKTKAEKNEEAKGCTLPKGRTPPFVPVREALEKQDQKGDKEQSVFH